MLICGVNGFVALHCTLIDISSSEAVPLISQQPPIVPVLAGAVYATLSSIIMDGSMNQSGYLAGNEGGAI